MTVSFHLQTTVPEDGGVVGPGRIGEIDRFRVWVKLALWGTVKNNTNWELINWLYKLLDSRESHHRDGAPLFRRLSEL